MLVGSLYAHLNLDASRFVGGLKIADTAIRVFDRSVHRASGGMHELTALLSTAGLAYLASEAVMAGDEIIKLDRRIRLLANTYKDMGLETKSLGEVSAEMYEWLIDTAGRTGQSFEELAKTYTQLGPAAATYGIAQAEVRDIILGTIGAGKAMGATNDEVSRSFVAIRQIVGKNALQMEELRQQLGEAMPLAFHMVAQGLTEMGTEVDSAGNKIQITTARLAKMIGNSEIDAERFMQAWGKATERYKVVATAAFYTVEGQMQRLANVMKEGVGRFMVDSDLQNDLAALSRVFVDTVDDMFGYLKSNAWEIGEQIRDLMSRTITDLISFIEKTANFNNKLIGAIMAGMEAVMTGFQTIWQALGPIGQEVGIIGMVLFGSVRKLMMLFSLGVGIMEKLGIVTREQVGNFFDIDSHAEGMTKFFNGVKTDVAVREVQALKDNLTDLRAEEKKYRDVLQNDEGGQNRFYNIDGEMVSREDAQAKFEAIASMVSDAETSLKGAEEKVYDLQGQAAMLAAGLHPKLSEQLGVGTEGNNDFATPLVNGLKQFNQQLSQAKFSVLDTNDAMAEVSSGLTAMQKEAPWAEQMSDNKVKTTVDGYINSLDKWSGGSPAQRVLADYQKWHRTFQATAATKIFDEKAGHGQLAGKEDLVQAAAITETIRKIVAAPFDNENQGNLNADVAERRQVIQGLINDMRVLAGSEDMVAVASKELADLGERADAAGAKYARAAETRTNKELQLLKRKVDATAAVEEAQRNASAALVEMITNPELYEAKGRQEAGEIRAGRKLPEAALYSKYRPGAKGEEGLRQLAAEGAIAQIARERVKLREQDLVLSGEGVQKALLGQAVDQSRFTMADQLRQIRRDTAMLDNQSLSSLRDQVYVEQQRLLVKQQTDDLERQMRALDTMSADDKRELLNLEILKLQAEAQNAGLRASQMVDPGYMDAQYQVDLGNQQLEAARMYYEYQLSMEQRLRLVRTQAIGSFVSIFSSGITDILTFQKSIGEGFKDIVRQMITGIIGFFVQWAVQQAAMWIMQKVGLISTQGTAAAALAATTTASAGAAAALAVAWATF